MIRKIGLKKSVAERLFAAGGVLSLLPAYIVVFSAFLDTHAQMPVLAPYAESLGAAPFMVGLAVGAYSFFNIAGNFLGGGAVDAVGWKKPLLLGLAGSALALLAYPLVPGPLTLVAVRGGHGMAGGFLVPAVFSALAARRRKDKEAAPVVPRMAYFGIAVGLAALIGPPLAGLAASRCGYPAVYLALSGVMILAALSALRLGDGTSGVQGLPLRAAPRSSGYRVILLSPRLRAASAFALGMMGATGILAAFFPTRAALLGASPLLTGLFFTAFALAAITVQGLWPLLFSKVVVDALRGACAGLLLAALALLLVPRIATTASFFAVMALYGTGFGLAFQGMLGLVAGLPDPATRGKAAGFFFACYSLGAAVLPPAAGFLWQIVPFLSPFYTGAAAALLAAASGVLLVKKQE